MTQGKILCEVKFTCHMQRPFYSFTFYTPINLCSYCQRLKHFFDNMLSQGVTPVKNRFRAYLALIMSPKYNTVQQLTKVILNGSVMTLLLTSPSSSNMTLVLTLMFFFCSFLAIAAFDCAFFFLPGDGS